MVPFLTARARNYLKIFKNLLFTFPSFGFSGFSASCHRLLKSLNYDVVCRAGGLALFMFQFHGISVESARNPRGMRAWGCGGG